MQETPEPIAPPSMSEPGFTPTTEAEAEAEYRPIEPWACLALGAGVLAGASSLAPVLWVLPVFGIGVGLIAVARLRGDAGRSGHRLAIAGLVLSVFFLALPLARTAANFQLLVHQARPVADQYLEFLREGSPEKAVMLEFKPSNRKPADEGLWLYFRSDRQAKEELLKFLRQPEVRVLLALGKKADIRFYTAAAIGFEHGDGQVDLWYTVTYLDEDDGDKKKTFLLDLRLRRRAGERGELSPWQVDKVLSGFDPR